MGGGQAGPIENTPRTTVQASVATAPPEGGVGPGETALLDEGAAHVFVSPVDAGEARVAINDFDTATLAEGGCNVTLTALVCGKAVFGYACSG